MKKIIYLVMAIILLASCKTEDLSFKITDQNGNTKIEVKQNGDIYYGAELTGNIDVKGTVKDKTGKVLAQMSDNDLLLDSNKKTLVKIDNNGTLDNGSGVYIKWNEDGQLIKGEEKLDVKLLSANQSVFKRASIVFFLYSYISNTEINES